MEYVRGSDYGGGVGGILYTLRGGAPAYTHYNSRGDVVAKTDATGSLTYQATYEAFGTRTAETGSTADRQKANTKDEDPTGLLNEGFRHRDLETGVFTTRDPAGFVDGPNLYTYVRQNPWSKFDPQGLESKTLARWHGTVPGISSTGDIDVPGPPSLSATVNTAVEVFAPDPIAAAEDVGEGIAETIDPGLSPLDRAKGAGKAAMGALEIVPLAKKVKKGIENGLDALSLSAKKKPKIAVPKGPVPPTGRKKVADMTKEERIEYFTKEKGVPKEQLGPSGYPKEHTALHPNRKDAKDAARNEGESAPVYHPNDEGQDPHFHATDESGQKKTGQNKGAHHSTKKKHQ